MDIKAFERIMLLIATFLKYPGVGCPEAFGSDSKKHHDALEQVRSRFQNLATTYGIELPQGYPAIPTLRKDLEILRKYGILDERMYRWGYYLGTGAMSQEELKVALNALFSQAKFQADPQVRRIHETLSKRLRGLNLELNGDLFYPVRQHLNRAIIYTDPEEMMNLGKNKDNLYHQLPILEKAISQGQAIEISRQSNPYNKNHIGIIQVYPLQLIYHDIAWYLLYEYCSNGHLAIGRVNRFANYCQISSQTGRGITLQRESLTKAYQLLENGWGLNLGGVEEQHLELWGELKFIEVKVRFYPPATIFILEGDRRHPKQTITKGIKNKTTGELLYVDYTIPLPRRSIDEFMLWVHRCMDAAQVISPPSLLEKHHQAAIKLLNRYS